MPEAQRSFASPGALNVIAALLEHRTGQQIAANRAWRVETALKPVLREHGMTTLDQLIGRLAEARDGPLADAVVNALLNQESSFFRDAGVLEMVADAALAMQADSAGRRLRTRSARQKASRTG